MAVGQMTKDGSHSYGCQLEFLFHFQVAISEDYFITASHHQTPGLYVGFPDCCPWPVHRSGHFFLQTCTYVRGAPVSPSPTTCL